MGTDVRLGGMPPGGTTPSGLPLGTQATAPGAIPPLALYAPGEMHKVSVGPVTPALTYSRSHPVRSHRLGCPDRGHHRPVHKRTGRNALLCSGSTLVSTVTRKTFHRSHLGQGPPSTSLLRALEWS